MDVHLIAIGGDLRMNGLLRAARRAGFTCHHAAQKEALGVLPGEAAAVVLPWPRSFAGDTIWQTEIKKEELIEHLPACGFLMGAGLDAKDFPMAKTLVDPGKDEALLTVNAKLTAEGAIAALLKTGEEALLHKTCLITGFGRIAQALARRLCAMEMFVVVCARNEQQMQLAHRMGAHPVPLARLSIAAQQADIVLNTIPFRVFGVDALAQLRPGVRFIELASAPYGADPEQAAQLGVSMEIMGGIPGKYAPESAGEALFEALQRAMQAESAEGGED